MLPVGHTIPIAANSRARSFVASFGARLQALPELPQPLRRVALALLGKASANYRARRDGVPNGPGVEVIASAILFIEALSTPSRRSNEVLIFKASGMLSKSAPGRRMGMMRR